MIKRFNDFLFWLPERCKTRVPSQRLNGFYSYFSNSHLHSSIPTNTYGSTMRLSDLHYFAFYYLWQPSAVSFFVLFFGFFVLYQFLNFLVVFIFVFRVAENILLCCLRSMWMISFEFMDTFFKLFQKMHFSHVRNYPQIFKIDIPDNILGWNSM